MTAAFYTLGCKVNQYETQAMEKLWEERGHTVTDFSQTADAYVVNTCSVTGMSDQKSRQAVRRVRREHPGAVVAVCGCFSQTHPAEADQLGADLVGGSGNRAAFVEQLERAVGERQAQTGDKAEITETKTGTAETKTRVGTAETKAEAAENRTEAPAGKKPGGPSQRLPALSRRGFEVLPPGQVRGRTRAMLKVEDGCSNFCTYCIIPYARGPVRSAPLATAVRQAEELRDSGIREIVVTGIEISSWGQDGNGGQSLIDLTEAVCRAVPEVRVRLGSLEPRTITEAFCTRAAALPNLCPQFHLSLQSGCDETLRRMRRRYDTARYARSLDLLRRAFRRPAITTDLIAGFPGETEGEFSQTLAFLAQCGFARVHVFPYSPRPGTPAAALPQIRAEVKADRARRAAEAAARTRQAYLALCVGEVYPVLFEHPRAGRLFGRAPNYMEVLADIPAAGEGRGEDEADLRNQIRPVRIVSSDSDALYGRIESFPEK